MYAWHFTTVGGDALTSCKKFKLDICNHIEKLQKKV